MRGRRMTRREREQAALLEAAVELSRAYGVPLQEVTDAMTRTMDAYSSPPTFSGWVRYRVRRPRLR